MRNFLHSMSFLMLCGWLHMLNLEYDAFNTSPRIPVTSSLSPLAAVFFLLPFQLIAFAVVNIDSRFEWRARED